MERRAITASEIAKFSGYCAHIYYESETKEAAAVVSNELDTRFKAAIRLERWLDDIGTHTRSMYRVAFHRTIFPQVVPQLALKRGSLTVLIHPESGDGLADHTAHAMWMGEVLEINRDVFDKD